MKVGPEYHEAVQDSVETAKKGLTFAEEAITFCEGLLRIVSDDSSIPVLITHLTSCAEAVYQSSKTMNTNFGNIRSKLYQVGSEQSSIR